MGEPLLADGFVYWRNDNGITKVAKSGGKVETLGDTEGEAVAIDEEKNVVAVQDSKRVRLSSSGQETLAVSPGRIGRVAVAGKTVSLGVGSEESR